MTATAPQTAAVCDVVALRNPAVVADRYCRRFVTHPACTRGVVVSRGNRYCDVLFIDGSQGEFTDSEVMRIAPAIV
jgi:hypothetical protein